MPPPNHGSSPISRLNLGMRNIPHPIVLQQFAAPQPSLLLLLACLSVPNWLPTLSSYGLMCWRPFWTFATENNTAYRVTFLLIQLSLVCGAILFLSRRYASAIWTPKPSERCRILVALLLLLPLLLFHLSAYPRGARALFALWNFPNHVQATEVLSSIHRKAWDRMAYGSSLLGIVCNSFLTFPVPLLEELVFTGFSINAIAKRYGLVTAVAVVPGCFAAVHIFEFGIGIHLLPLFVASLTYVAIRLCTGSLRLAVIAHWTINVAVMLPKWVIAVMHFNRQT